MDGKWDYRTEYFRLLKRYEKLRIKLKRLEVKHGE